MYPWGTSLLSAPVCSRTIVSILFLGDNTPQLDLKYLGTIFMFSLLISGLKLGTPVIKMAAGKITNN